MTARQVYEAVLIELSKIQAPPLKLFEFNYLFNKAINQFINKVYNFYDINQQTTDDLRVLKSTAYLTPTSLVSDRTIKYVTTTHEVILPEDYLHLLNCVCVFSVAQQKDCYDTGDIILVPATKLTADSWATIVNNLYTRPTPMNPYYYIHNVNNSINLPTNTTVDNLIVNPQDESSSIVSPTSGEGSGEVVTVPTYTETIEKNAGTRDSNVSNVRLEIRYGKDTSVFNLIEVQVDYIKSPQFIRLTQKQIDETQDKSQVMEFPDYINQQIINELVFLVMERNGDPRLSTTLQINQSIARPTQQQQQPQSNN